MNNFVWCYFVEDIFNALIDGLRYLENSESNSQLSGVAMPFRSKKSHKVYVKRCFYE